MLTKTLRLIPFLLVIALMALAIACGDDDAAPPRATLEVTAADEQAIDKAIADVMAALKTRTRTALDPIANEGLLDRPEQLDDLATCYPEGANLEVRNREIKAGTESIARVTINFTVTENGASENSRRDWRFERQADGAYKLNDAPDCPFGRAVPSAAPETVAPETETPVEGEDSGEESDTGEETGEETEATEEGAPVEP